MPSRPRSDVFTAVILLGRFWKLSASLLSVSICCVKDWALLDASMPGKTFFATSMSTSVQKRITRAAFNYSLIYAKWISSLGKGSKH